MLKNFLKISFRILIRQPLTTFISVVGLVIGLSACLVAFLFAHEDLSYDNFHTKGKRIYRLAVERIYPDHTSFYANVPSSYAVAIKNEFPEVQAAVRLYKSFEDVQVTIGGKKFKESKVIFADSGFFELFSFPLLEGNPKTALRAPDAVVLTQSTAYKYFGKQAALGKTIQTSTGTFIVTGVCADVPKQSHFDFDLVGNSQKVEFPIEGPNYIFFNAYTYLLLAPGTSPAKVEEKLDGLVEKYAAGQVQRHLGMAYKSYKQAGNGYRYFLQPLRQIYLHSHLEAELKPNGNYVYLLVFGLVALLLLLIALLNYVNLATARSFLRIKEVSIRKVLGARLTELKKQFLTESLMLSIFSGICAIVVVILLLPYLNQLTSRDLRLSGENIIWIFTGGILAAVGTGILAGLYPALIISSFPVVASRKTTWQKSSRRLQARDMLVGFQFFISIILITATLVIYKQVSFMQAKDLGFTNRGVVVIRGIEQLTDSLSDKRAVFRQALLRLPGVTTVGWGNPVPGDVSFGFQFKAEGAPQVITCRGMMMDENYGSALGFRIVEGRSFSSQFNDTYSVVVNEKAVEELGLKDPIGKRLQMISVTNDSLQNKWYTIVGVLQNFHFQSLHQKISSLIMIHTSNPLAYTPFMLVKLAPNANKPDVMRAIGQQWQELNPQEPFSYFYLEEYWRNLLAQERNYQQLFTLFGGITLTLACAGLFGLSAYFMQVRQKEVSIRKILGASASDIVLLLSKNFVTVVLLAFVLALPVSWYGLHQWLTAFAYRITLSSDMFLAAGFLTVGCGFLTMGYHFVKVVTANPIESLKEE